MIPFKNNYFKNNYLKKYFLKNKKQKETKTLYGIGMKTVQCTQFLSIK